MIKLPRTATGHDACGRSGLPLIALCPCGCRRSIPFRRLKTDFGDTTPLYGRPFQRFVCGSRDVTLFALETKQDLDAVRSSLRYPPETDERSAPTTHSKRQEFL